jgi:voltage-gated potassium channel
MPASERFYARVTNVVADSRIFPFLVLVTVAVGLLGGFLATVLDDQDFPTFGDGVWWSIVTLATVGYGDLVPTTPLGRLVGSALILVGVTFLTFLTAIVTSLFVSTDQDKARAREQAVRDASDSETRALLLKLDERLGAIEAKLGQ